MVSFDRPLESMLGALPLLSSSVVKKVSRISRCGCTSRVRDDHVPVGVSGHVKIMTNAVNVIRMNGTAKTTRHATWAVRFCLRTSELNQLGDPSQREGQTGRWVLLYCVLQILSTISVDTPKSSFKNVSYFLNPRLQGIPP
jgi:hypothetical protein